MFLDEGLYGGSMLFGDKQYANAYFDELRVYNRALSTSEVN